MSIYIYRHRFFLTDPKYTFAIRELRETAGCHSHSVPGPHLWNTCPSSDNRWRERSNSYGLPHNSVHHPPMQARERSRTRGVWVAERWICGGECRIEGTAGGGWRWRYVDAVKKWQHTYEDRRGRCRYRDRDIVTQRIFFPFSSFFYLLLNI